MCSRCRGRSGPGVETQERSLSWGKWDVGKFVFRLDERQESYRNVVKA